MKLLNRILLIVSILIVCALGIRVALFGGVSFSIDLVNDPTGPVMLILRALLLLLSAWVGAVTLFACIAHGLGWTRAATAAISLLPRQVGALVQRSIGVTVLTAMLLNGSALAKPSADASGPTAEQSYVGNTGNGQRWPSGLAGDDVIIDPNAPQLIAVTQRPGVTPTTRLNRPVTGSKNQKPTPVVETKGAISVPIGGTFLHAEPNGASPQPTSGVAKLLDAKPSSHSSASPVTTPSQTQSTTPSTTPIQPNAPHQLASSAASYTVVAGDHFWGIAERAVARVHTEPSEALVREYWLRLVQHNRTRLPDPQNPDLLLVGTNIELPTV